MSRSNWKGPYIQNNYKNIKSLQKLKENKTHKNILKINRNSEITPNFIGSTFKVHNGIKNVSVLVINKMLGYKFGEFCPTRVQFVFKKKKSKK